MNHAKINFTQIYTDFDRAIEQFRTILSSSDREEATQYIQKLTDEAKAIRENPILKLAFIGQYSAGKSTIISALTGNRKISIGSDITTDKATPYSWNSIKIMDTPGIGTERQDHDEVTYKAIEEADLLVFCTTHMLLDSHIIQHFRKLAYEKCYSHKMMLVFNKLSAEAGDDNQKIANYRASMIQALHPHSLDDFPVCFFDAKDYCEGIDENEEDLIEISRFPSFIEELNKFIKEQDKLAQIDTPIRRVLGYVEDVEGWFVERPEQDAMFTEALNRILRRVRDERNELRVEVKRIALKANSTIRRIGSEFANDLLSFTSESDFELRQKEIETELVEIWNWSEKELQRAIENSIQSLQKDIEDVLNSNFVLDFIAMLEEDTEVNQSSIPKGFNFENFRQQVDYLKGMANQLGFQIGNMATRQVLKTGGGATLRGIDVVGGQLHQTVLAIGKFVGFKFRPWQAVGIAKNLGNAAKFLGPVVGLVGAGLEIADLMQQEEQAQQAREAQGKIDREFARIANKVEQQLKEQLHNFEQQTFDYIEMQLRTEKEKYRDRQIGNSKQVEKLMNVQKSLDDLITQVSLYRG